MATDVALQALLDPAPSTGLGIMLVRRVDDAAGLVSSYYCAGNVTGVGRSMWVAVTTADTDAQHNTSIRAAFNVA